MSKVSTNIYDTKTNKSVSGYIENGKTYTSDGNRITSGMQTTASNGKTYQMGDDGLGHEVTNDSNSNSTGGNASSTGGYKEAQKVDFDTDAQYNAVLKAKQALLESTYNSSMNTLNNNYNSEMALAKDDVTETNSNYDDSVKTINKQTYDDVQRSKVLSAQRGVMNSEQGLAADQSQIRQGNNNVNTVTKQRNQALTDLQTRIANLTNTYSNDKLTAEKNYGLGQTQAQNEALSTKLSADLDIAKTNTASANTFIAQSNEFQHADETQKRDMQFQMQKQANEFDQQVKMFGLDAALQKELKKMDTETQKYCAQLSAGAQVQCARINAASSSAALQFAKTQYADEHAMVLEDRQTAKTDKQKALNQKLYESDSNWNPNVKLNFWDAGGGSMSTDAKMKQVKLQEQALRNQGYSEAQIAQFAKDNYMTSTYSWFNDLFK